MANTVVGAAASMSLRSTSSGSSTSSLSSTFSDITSSSTSSSSPPNLKTNAFFASPFSTRPPSPSLPTPPALPPPPPKASQNNRSLTAEFFGTPTRPPSPPASLKSPSSSSSNQKTPHLSRIFPSRYTSVSDRHSSDFYFDSIGSINDDHDLPDFFLPHTHTRERAPSTGSESSSSVHSPRLPTPPPLYPHTPHREDTITQANFPSTNITDTDTTMTITPKNHDHIDENYEEPTPRPASLQPGLLRFERELILQAQAKERLRLQELSKPPPPPEPPKVDAEEEGLEDEEPHPGSIISLPSRQSMRVHSRPTTQSHTQSHSYSQSHLPLAVSPLSLTFTIASPAPGYAYENNGTRRPLVADRETPTPTPIPMNEFGSHTRNSSLAELKPLPSPPPTASSLSPSSPSSLISPLDGQQQQHYKNLEPPALTRKDRAHHHHHHQQEAPKLRLLRPLGHGAFSAVWLAEDLSRVPLTLVSKKSVRDLRRRASGRERERERDRERDRDRDKAGRGMDVDIDARGTEEEVGQEKEKEQKEGGSGGNANMGVSSKPQQQQRAPSTSRIKEGLRNMWSFSRSAATTVIGVNPPAPTPVSASVSKPSGGGGAGAGVEEKKEEETVRVDVRVEGDAGGEGGNPLSRNSSIRSISTASTTSSLALSRQSSIQSHSHSHSQAQGRPGSASHSNSSLRLNLGEGTTLSRDSSLRKFSERVRGTRPAFVLGRRASKRTKRRPGDFLLDERDGEVVVVVGPGGVGGSDGGYRERSSSEVDVETMNVDYEHRHGHGHDEDDGGVGLGASLSRQSSLGTSDNMKTHGNAFGRLVAVKMTPRRPQSGGGGVGTTATAREREREREEEERTRVGFVREVEVLKHISHPNITPLLAHLSTASRHILVLPYLPGGDLLGLVNNDVAWGMLGESVLKRIWCEICKAVGWMHGVGLVHRDIKLENVLLTTPAFSSLTQASSRPTLSSLPAPPAPFVKLTDFGLSRFVEIDANGDAELLSTRCGSEAYAAPELVTGGGSSSGSSSSGGGNRTGTGNRAHGGNAGVYDARKTDAWACGVVLFALVGRQLPFGEGVDVPGGGGGGGGGGKSRCRIGGERGNDEELSGLRRTSLADRRHWLMRIARGEWEWPGQEEDEQKAKKQDTEKEEDNVLANGGEDGRVHDRQADELVGPQLVKSKGARRIVSRLLVRDPKKRARVVDLWDDAWMHEGEDEGWWREREMNMNMNMSVDGDGDEVRRHHYQQHRHYHRQDTREGSDVSWTFDGNGQELRGDVDVRFYDEPSLYSSPVDVEGEEGAEAAGVEGEDGEEEDDDDDEDEDEDEEGGCLFDHEPIDSITRQEVI